MHALKRLFNNNIYDQIDRVSMISCLGSVLANIIMSKFESEISIYYLIVLQSFAVVMLMALC